MTESHDRPTHIRSFGTRRGHITDKQQAAIDRLQPRYCMPYARSIVDLAAVFGNANPVVVEIGCGMGETSVQIAAANPDVNYLGLEVYPAGVGALLVRIEQYELQNFKVIQHDAVEVFADMLPAACLAGVNIFFPDPWPKKRHHKRRLIQAPFVRLLVSRLTQGAIVHCATDWQSYADEMLAVLTANPQLRNLCTGPGGFVPRPESRPTTKFETRGLALGHGVWDLQFVRTT